MRRVGAMIVLAIARVSIVVAIRISLLMPILRSILVAVLMSILMCVFWGRKLAHAPTIDLSGARFFLNRALGTKPVGAVAIVASAGSRSLTLWRVAVV